MKVGLILECALGGPDQQVFEYLMKELNPAISVVCQTLVNKPKLKAQCGTVAKQLLADGCNRVGIVWDLFPAWRVKPNEVHSRDNDRREIIESLSTSGVMGEAIELVCISEELEAWLLSDERAINSFLSHDPHYVTEKRIKKTELVKNPKKRLNSLFQKHRNRKYCDVVDAVKLISSFPNFERIKNCCSFNRFASRLAGVNF